MMQFHSAQSHFNYQHDTVSASGPKRYCSGTMLQLRFRSQIKDVTICPNPNWCRAKNRMLELPPVVVSMGQQAI